MSALFTSKKDRRCKEDLATGSEMRGFCHVEYPLVRSGLPFAENFFGEIQRAIIL